MNKQTLQMLASMPQEMLAAWETRHSAKWSVRHIARNYARRDVLSVLFCFAGLLLLAGTAATVFPEKMEIGWVGPIATGTVILFAVGVLLEDRFISHRTEQDAIIESLETAVKDSDIDLLFYLRCGSDSRRIREAVHSLLVGTAQAVLEGEEHFNRLCKKDKVPEVDIIIAGQDLLRRRNVFKNRLFQATQFGLSDGSSQKYFKEAASQLV